MVHAYCRCLIKNKQDAEDIFQDTFIKFYNYLDKIEHVDNLSGYLVTIVRSIFFNMKRKEKDTVQIDGMDFSDDSELPYENKELLEIIIMSVELLDEHHRKAFILREFDGLPYPEVAVKCGVTLSNAKMLVYRAKHKIIKILEPYLNDVNKTV